MTDCIWHVIVIFSRSANITECVSEIGRFLPKSSFNYSTFGDNRKFFSNKLFATENYGMSNALFEIVSTWGIARTLNR
jgi:hypothetical protein